MSIPEPSARTPWRVVFLAVSACSRWLLLVFLVSAGAGLLWSTLGRPSRASIADPPAGPEERLAEAEVELVAPAEVRALVAAPVEPASDRTAVRERQPARPLAGILRSAAGEAHAGATLSWTVLLPELDGRDFLREVDPERMRAVTVTTTSDSSGRFAFERAPAELGDSPSVVWVTRAGHEAGRFVLGVGGGSGPERARAPGALARAPREILRVRVTRAGAPVAGALVRHQLSFWGADPPAAERRLRRGFLREGLSGADGTLELVPGPGDNAVQAFYLDPVRGGEESSLHFSGRPEGALELELLPTIEVSGRVSVTGPAVDLAGVRYRVSYFSAADPSDLVLAQGSTAVRADGTIGPDRWPRAARERMRVTLFGGEIEGADAEYATPAPGGGVFVELATRRGYTLEALVRAADATPLGEAFVYAFRPAGSSWTFAAQGATDADGRVTVRGLPAGALSLEFGKPGYTTLQLADHRTVLPRREEGPLAVVLQPSGVIAGRVTSAGAPVKRFTLFGWTSDRGFEIFADHEDEEGRFEIENAPREEALHLFAFTDELPQSDTVVVVPGETPAEVQLDLPRPRRARGRVIDTLTGLPVASATILHATSGLTGLATPRGKTMRVEADGRFELDGFFPGRGGFSVRAEGYEPLHYSTRVDESEVIDVGLVPLNPLCTLEVYVREEDVGDYSAYRVWNACNDDRTPVALRADGTRELVSNTGKYLVHVSRPDGSVLVSGGVATPGSVEVVEFDLSRGIELAVLVREPTPRLEDARLTAWWRAGGLERRSEAGWSAELEAFVLRGLAPGAVVLQLVDAAGSSLGQRELRIADRARQSVTLELGGVRRRLRLVGPRGDPWASCTVYAALEGESGWYATATTDAAGELELGPLDETRVVLSARLGNESLAYGQRVELDPDPARATVVTLEPGERSLLRLVELGAPRAGVHVAYRHAAAPNAVEFGYMSDEEGLVKGPFCAPGTYELRVNHSDFWPARPSLWIDGASRPATVELFSRGTLELDVTELGGRPIAGARLELAHRELRQDVASWIAAGLLARPPGGLTSDGDGRVVLAGVPRGTYAWRWVAPSGETASGEVVLAPRARAEVVGRIALER